MNSLETSSVVTKGPQNGNCLPLQLCKNCNSIFMFKQLKGSVLTFMLSYLWKIKGVKLRVYKKEE